MKIFWTRLGNTQQTQILVLASAALLGLYMLWFNGIYKDNVALDQKISRRINRLESRAVTPPPTKNTAGSEKKIGKLQKSVDDDNRNFQRLLQRFAPLDSPEHRQTLRRELAELASGLGMRVIRLEGALGRSKDSSSVPTFDEGSDIDKHTGRPLINFEAWGGYFALQTLLDDLSTLSYTVAPIRVELIADEPKMSARQGVEQQQILRINLVFAI
ncbi:hypothetical protein A9Q99_05285 [Gammaproteobacteria bacterium 45_16_T64]|nr:hypothetical protein A9Q99_05285 [Gammaproteobacteria bacterium 45_16_T64]